MSDQDRSRKVLALYRKAAGTDNPHERDAFLAKARELDVEPTRPTRPDPAPTFDDFFTRFTAPAGAGWEWYADSEYEIGSSRTERPSWWEDARRRAADIHAENPTDLGYATWYLAAKRARAKERRDQENEVRQSLGLSWAEYRALKREQRDLAEAEYAARRKARWATLTNRERQRRHYAKVSKTPEYRERRAAYMREYRRRRREEAP